MDKIEIIKKALSESGLYSNNQCKVLNVLLDIAVNNVAQANVRFIEEKTGVKFSSPINISKAAKLSGKFTSWLSRSKSYAL